MLMIKIFLKVEWKYYRIDWGHPGGDGYIKLWHKGVGRAGTMCIKMFTEKIFGPESNKVRLKKEKQHQLISSSVTVVQSYTHLCFQIFKWPWTFHKPLIPSLDSALSAVLGAANDPLVSRRMPPPGSSHGWECILALSFLRHFKSLS